MLISFATDTEKLMNPEGMTGEKLMTVMPKSL